MFETHVTVVGTLITDVTRRRLVDGGSVVNFRVASNERRFDRDTENWVNGDSLYISVTCWRQLAENVHRTFNMGDPIIVRGRLRTRNYEDKESRRHSVIELEGLNVGPDLARASAVVTRLRRDGTPLALAVRGAESDSGEAPGGQHHVDDSDSCRREDDQGPADDHGPHSDLGDSPMSDDPWRIPAVEPDGAGGNRAEPADVHRAPAEAAVGA